MRSWLNESSANQAIQPLRDWISLEFLVQTAAGELTSASPPFKHTRLLPVCPAKFAALSIAELSLSQDLD
ncbi:hypothetical protein ACFOEY_00975 [Paracandidimonas soli]|uniref:hypothetical protein n=1 Tax=Paracandidimonas soli TaxID=1917182 RepID=UPI0036138DF3